MWEGIPELDPGRGREEGSGVSGNRKRAAWLPEDKVIYGLGGAPQPGRGGLDAPPGALL